MNSRAILIFLSTILLAGFSLQAESVIYVKTKKIEPRSILSNLDYQMTLGSYISKQQAYYGVIEVPEKRFLPLNNKKIEVVLPITGSQTVKAKLQACENLKCSIKVFYPYRGLSGQTVKVKTLIKPQDLITVPISSVLSPDGKSTYVYTFNRNKAYKNNIQLWPSTQPLGLVIDGISAGDDLIVSGQEHLINEQNVERVQ